MANEPSENTAHLQHEAGDRTYVAHVHFVEFVGKHTFVAERPELKALAGNVEDALAQLYQAIWRA